MIRTPAPSPQQRLAAALGATILGPSTILAGAHLITASPLGVVRCDRTPIGRWDDATGDLVAAFGRVVAA